MHTIARAAALVGLTAWVIVLRRQLRAARRRSAMYRAVAARLERQLAELRRQER